MTAQNRRARIAPYRHEEANDRAWDTRRDVAEALAAHLGLDRFGDNRPWHVGGADLVVRFALNEKTGRWEALIVSGWPSKGPRRSLALHEAFAISITRRLGKYGGTTGALWKTRMLVETGLVALPSLSFPALPDVARESARKTYSWVQHLVSIRRLMRLAGEPFPLTDPFLVDWSGGELTEKEAEAGRRWLDRHRFIVRAGRGKATGRVHRRA